MADHIRYVEHFINDLDLHNITLVMHGSGSIIGSHLAMQQPTRYKGLAYIEYLVYQISHNRLSRLQ
jgi:haloalkane dehalogenase